MIVFHWLYEVTFILVWYSFYIRKFLLVSLINLRKRKKKLKRKEKKGILPELESKYPGYLPFAPAPLSSLLCPALAPGS